jgi:putative PIN family toxin of toxin-antitoxin system
MVAVKVVVDTNVLVSALLFGGKPGKLIPLWQRATIRPVASKEIIDEYLRVLTYPKFKLAEEDINFLLYREILPYSEVADVEPCPRIIKKDPEDDKFMRCALAGKAKWIISGDRHLLAFKTYQKIKILTPSDFLKKLIR